MSNGYWNPYQPARRYATHEEEIEEDVPRSDLPGWRLPTPSAYLDHDGRSSRIVTRPSDYVPYQSIAQPDGRHAYDPAARQYPQPFREERRSGRVAHRAADRQNLWDQIRPNPMYHPPGATIELPYRDDPRNMPPPPPPPPPPAATASRDQAAGFMQHNHAEAWCGGWPCHTSSWTTAAASARPQARPCARSSIFHEGWNGATAVTTSRRQRKRFRSELEICRRRV